jgi:predicted nucleotidyltransferase component of viral defense system
MIPNAYITHWRNYYPWPLEEQVEQDLILCRILLDIYSDPFLSNRLAFRGGTALQKLYFNQVTRYSEDVDLVQIIAGPIGDTINRIRAKIDPWLGAPSYRRNEGRFTLYYTFLTENMPYSQRKVKIEINTREHFSVLGYVDRAFQVESPWVRGEVQIKTYEIEELLGTKMRALFQRKKGRDLFDLGVALELLTPDLNRMIHCFNTYVEHKVTRAQFEQNLYEKLNEPSFMAEVGRLVAVQSGFLEKLNAYTHQVYQKIIPQLSGAAWKSSPSIFSKPAS